MDDKPSKFGRLMAILQAMTPFFLKYIVPLLGLGVAGGQAVVAAQGDASIQTTAAVMSGGIIASIGSFFSGLKVSVPNGTALRAIVLQAVDALFSAIDRAADDLKALIRERVLTMLAKLFPTDTPNGVKAQEYIAALGVLHAKELFPKPANSESDQAAPVPTPVPSPAPTPVPSPST